MSIEDISDNTDIEMNRKSRQDSLPLYSETFVAAPTSVPDDNADRDTVRDYFCALLVSIRHDSNADARAIAAKWNDTGRELKTYPPEMFLQVLGPEDGWLIYRETQLLKKRSTPEDVRKAIYI